MSLTITRSRIKEKCGVTDTSYDSTIDNLIAELGPVIEYSIEPAYLAGEAGLVATLNLGATELVCGEFLMQQERELGATEGINWNGLELFSRKTGDDADTLKAQGAARLAPYLRVAVSVIAVGSKEGEE